MFQSLLNLQSNINFVMHKSVLKVSNTIKKLDEKLKFTQFTIKH